MKLPLSLFAVALFACSGFAHGEDCADHFTTKGNFFTGKEYTTWQAFTGITEEIAFKRLYSAVVKNGFKIAQSDKDAGVISAAQEVSFGNGKNAPLNIISESVVDGVKVTMTFSTSGGVAIASKTVQKQFCDLLAGVSQ